MKVKYILVLLICLCILPAALSETGEICAHLKAGQENITVFSTRKDDEEWLIFPSFADPSALELILPDHIGENLQVISPDSDTVCMYTTESGLLEADLSSTLPKASDPTYLLIQNKSGQTLQTLNLMMAGDIASLFLESGNSDEDRQWLEDTPRHERATTGHYLLVSSDDVKQGGLQKIRGRGNATWSINRARLPYQITLDRKEDLLGTDRKSKRAKTWVLLAMDLDATMLHDRIVLDMAREMGLSQLEAQPVNLYYDGEYRGLYLLCDKAEIGKGRIDITDSEEMIRRINRDIQEWDTLQTATGHNRFGLEYAWCQGVKETDDPENTAYLLEIEHSHTLSSPCWFRLSGNKLIGVKSPTHLSESQMRYISEKMEVLMQTLLHGGRDPETGQTLEEQMDVDAFARYALLQELSGNMDGFHASCFFILEEHSDRFVPGPPWDFDLSLRYRLNAGNSAIMMNDNGEFDFLPLLYGCPSFWKSFRNEAGKWLPVLREILAGETPGRELLSLTEYESEIALSRHVSGQMFKGSRSTHLLYGPDEAAESELLRAYLTERLRWLEEITGEDPCRVRLQFHAICTNLENTLTLESSIPHLATVESMKYTRIRETEDGVFYSFEAIIRPSGEVPQEILIGDAVCTPQILPGGTLAIQGTILDNLVLPADYEGEDVGRIYNEAAYRQNYPELSEAYGDDSEGLLEYFMQEGIYEGQKGNTFFDPKEVAAALPEVSDMFGESWDLYYDDFLTNEDNDWMILMNKRYIPPVTEQIP